MRYDRELRVALLACIAHSLACSSSGGETGDGGKGHSGGSVTDAAPDRTAPRDGSHVVDSGHHDTSTGTRDGGVDSSLPADAGSNVSMVGTGEYATFYLRDGVIYGYGGSSLLLAQGTYQGLVIPPRPIDSPAGLKFISVQSGLHQTMAIDATNHVWTWGEVDQGLQGSGNDAAVGSVPYEVTTDVNGNPFDDIVWIEPSVANSASEQMYDVAIKKDGTVWIWGNAVNGLLGDGTAGGVLSKPTQVPLPVGVKITKALGASMLVALTSDGDVYTWGSGQGNILGTGMTGATDGYTPQKVVDLPSTIVDIAVGFGGFAYALTSSGELYGWGEGGGYLGLGSNDAGFYFPTPTPILLTSVLNLPDKVVSVVCDMLTTHVILADGSLWGWGDDAMGMVGDGQELDYATQTPPYAWNFGQFDLPVWKPVRIAPSVSNFKAVFAHAPFLFYDYALTTTGDLYSWGRNKTGTLGNGVYALAANGNSGTSSNMSATYPNSWDVTKATLVTPFATPAKGENSPYCVANPDASACN